LALGAFADSVAGQGRKIKEKRIATAMEALALVYEKVPGVSTAPARDCDGRAGVASRSQFEVARVRITDAGRRAMADRAK
jgi:hypothetical protein